METRKIICKPVTFGGPTKKPSRYWKFKNNIEKHVIKNKLNNPIITNTFFVKIWLHIHESRIKVLKNRKSYNDLDNFLKPIIDALHKALVFETEAQIKKIEIERVFDDEEGVEIKIVEDGKE